MSKQIKFNPLVKKGFDLMRKTLSWLNITDKPDTYPPDPHTHDRITDGNTELRQQGNGSYATGDMTIAGSLTVEGEHVVENVKSVSVEDNIQFLNAGEQGAGIAEGQAGHEYDRGTATPYRHVFDETSESVRVGAFDVFIDITKTGGFSVFDTIQGLTSGAQAKIRRVRFFEEEDRVHIVNYTGTFLAGEMVRSESGSEAEIKQIITSDQTQALTTRPDSNELSDGQIAVWDAGLNRLKFVANTLHSHANKALLDNLTQTMVENWNAAHGWGNHAVFGYLTKNIKNYDYGEYIDFHLDDNNFVRISTTMTTGALRLRFMPWIDGNMQPGKEFGFQYHQNAWFFDSKPIHGNGSDDDDYYEFTTTEELPKTYLSATDPETEGEPVKDGDIWIVQ